MFIVCAINFDVIYETPAWNVLNFSCRQCSFVESTFLSILNPLVRKLFPSLIILWIPCRRLDLQYLSKPPHCVQLQHFLLSYFGHKRIFSSACQAAIFICRTDPDSTKWACDNGGVWCASRHSFGVFTGGSCFVANGSVVLAGGLMLN